MKVTTKIVTKTVSTKVQVPQTVFTLTPREALFLRDLIGGQEDGKKLLQLVREGLDFGNWELSEVELVVEGMRNALTTSNVDISVNG